MKKTTLKRIAVITMSMLALLAMLTVTAFATDTEPAPQPPVNDAPIQGAPEAPEANTPADTLADVLKSVFSGTNLALLGAALAVALPCMGSAKGVGIVGEASSGLLSQDPSQFGKALALQALPMTQGVYGLVAAFLMLFRLGLFGNVSHLANLSVGAGAYYLMASLPIALAGFYSAVRQGRVSAAGINLLSKRPGELGKAITSSVLVETYAIFSLLITLLVVWLSPFNA